MRILDLRSVPHRSIDAHGSLGFTIGAFGVTSESALVSVSLRPGGVIGRHPAAGRQLLVVLDGDAQVRGDDEVPTSIGPGQAAVWESGESHETRTIDGLTALVIEGDLDVSAQGHVVDPGDT